MSSIAVDLIVACYQKIRSSAAFGTVRVRTFRLPCTIMEGMPRVHKTHAIAARRLKKKKCLMIIFLLYSVGVIIHIKGCDSKKLVLKVRLNVVTSESRILIPKII